MTRRTVLAWGYLAASGRLLRAEIIRLTPNSESEFALDVKKTGLMAGKKHHFVFSRYERSVSQPPSPQITFIVEAKSLVCQDDWLKPKDVEKVTRYAVDDLLEANKYPELRYRSTAVKSDVDGYTISGNLTIKDVTRPLIVNTIHQPASAMTWTGGATIRLTDFNLKPPTAALGAIGTEDAMQLLFHLTSKAAA